MAVTTSGTSAGPTKHVSREAGRYLLELYWESLDRDDRVPMGAITDQLDVSAASVTEMVGKLEERDVVEYEKYDGVELTEWGETIAEALAWRYCVVMNFFRETLDVSIERSTAYRIGYTLPGDGVTTLGDRLGMACMRACTESSRPRERCQHQSHAPN